MAAAPVPILCHTHGSPFGVSVVGSSRAEEPRAYEPELVACGCWTLGCTGATLRKVRFAVVRCRDRVAARRVAARLLAADVVGVPTGVRAPSWGAVRGAVAATPAEAAVASFLAW
ncbi:hypothetical protein GCM10009845_36190 [Pedococcus bigeumensis]